MLSAHEQKLKDGWILYYNEEGYPYYYNESSGESEWAEYEEYNYDDSTGLAKTSGGGSDHSDSENESSDEEDDEEESENDSDEESDDDSHQQREQRVFDKKLEQKFKEYLKTPEGIAAAQAELERVGRKVDKRLAKKYSLVEQEYVRSLKSKKKEVSVPSNSIFGKLMETTNAWMFPPAEDKSSDSQDGSAGSSKRNKKGAITKFDDYNRETKQRHGTSSAAAVETGRAGWDSNAQQQPTRGSPSSSRSSSLSSDTGSFSSDDSDIAQIDAPLFSEVPVAWYNLSNVTNRLFGAWLQSTTATNAADGDNASTTSSSTTSTVVTVPAVNATLQYLQESTAVVAEQGFTIIGGAFVQGFGLLFERLNPMLESFVNGLLDAQMPAGPPRSRAAQRRLAAAAIANPSAERDLEQQERPDYSTLPPAPPARAPLSARAPPSARGPPTHTPRGGVRPSPRVGGVTGPANTLPTAPLPVSRSRQSTPRVPAVVESSPLTQLQDKFKSNVESSASPPINERSQNKIESEAPAHTQPPPVDATVPPLATEECVSEPAASVTVIQEVEETAVKESIETQSESVQSTTEVAEIADVAEVAEVAESVPTHSESTVTQEKATDARSVSPTEDIQNSLLKLALATQDVDNEDQVDRDEIVAEVEMDDTLDARSLQLEADLHLSATDGETLQTEEVKIGFEAEKEALDVESEPTPTGETETAAAKGMETTELHDEEAGEIGAKLSAVIDANLSKEAT